MALVTGLHLHRAVNVPQSRDIDWSSLVFNLEAADLEWSSTTSSGTLGGLLVTSTSQAVDIAWQDPDEPADKQVKLLEDAFERCKRLRQQLQSPAVATASATKPTAVAAAVAPKPAAVVPVSTHTPVGEKALSSRRRAAAAAASLPPREVAGDLRRFQPGAVEVDKRTVEGDLRRFQPGAVGLDKRTVEGRTPRTASSSASATASRASRQKSSSASKSPEESSGRPHPPPPPSFHTAASAVAHSDDGKSDGARRPVQQSPFDVKSKLTQSASSQRTPEAPSVRESGASKRSPYDISPVEKRKAARPAVQTNKGVALESESDDSESASDVEIQEVKSTVQAVSLPPTAPAQTVSRPLASRDYDVDPLNGYWTPTPKWCRNGRGCVFLAGGYCQYYHPQERHAAPDDASVVGGRRWNQWNVLVRREEQSRDRGDLWMGRSRSPHRLSKAVATVLGA